MMKTGTLYKGHLELDVTIIWKTEEKNHNPSYGLTEEITI